MTPAEPELLLRELGGWDGALCRRQLPCVLPRLLSMYQNSDDWTEHIRVLRILIEMFLPHINLSELEQTFFSKVLPKAIQFFDDLLYELCNQAKGLTSQNTELCKSVRNVLQDSEAVYSGCLHLISDLLQSLFKETYSLQKQLMELLDMISVESDSAEDTTVDMVLVIHTVLDICSVISNMDHALHANTWKFIIKQSLKHHSLLHSHLKHKDILCGLCKDTLVSFHSCLQLAEQMRLSVTQESTDLKLFQKTVKLCRFFANSLVHYTKEFIPFLTDCCCQLHQLYLQVYSKFPPSLYAPVIPEAHQDEITRVFLVALDRLIHQLLPFKPFLEQVLSEKLDLSPELHLPQCHLLITITAKLPAQPEDVQALWTTGSQLSEEVPRLSLFSALFFSFQQCSGELSFPVCFPGEMGNGRAEVPVTLYQHVCVHLCAFIAAIPPSQFPHLERALLDAVLGSNMITSLLAMDLWCFLARYGTADLCAHHVLMIAHLIKSCPGECYQLSILGVLLKRMLFLMAPDHQVEFTQKFPPKEAENLPLWQHISLKALTPDLRKQVSHQLCVLGLSQCKQWLSSRCILGELQPVNVALSVLLTACNSAGDTLEGGLQAAILGTASQLWALLQVKQVSSQPCLQQTLCLILPLLEFFIQTLDPQLITQVFATQASLLESDPPDHVRLAVLGLLSSTGKLLIPQEIQGQVIPKLSCLFSSLLADKTWLIYQHALEAFTQFAEATRYEDVVPQCLNSEETKNKVVCFLAKTRQVEETAEARAERVKHERAVCSAHLLKMKMDGEWISAVEPLAKRACQSPCEEEYKSAIDTAEGALDAVKLLMQKGPAPAWLTMKLEALQTSINILRNSVKL
ncbi:FIGNL1-interacting regulator of recombination and mitosis isoform X2 [Carettochelys insculpta]|uniref:FIGNL1-interacting regulator of recombination and mitosis isoform X2 n=1 Tax=Carettochelys insculpta TaxID=44489 RepID=UPI003EB85C87